jgi:hypothetical protein
MIIIIIILHDRTKKKMTSLTIGWSDALRYARV